MVAYPDVQVLDVMGPLEVFSRTARWLRDHGKRRDLAYSVEIIGLRRGMFRASSGLRLYADRGFLEVGRGVDTLLVAGGKTTREIADVLGISVKTAESHRTHILKKLDTPNIAGVVRYAIRQGLIKV